MLLKNMLFSFYKIFLIKKDEPPARQVSCANWKNPNMLCMALDQNPNIQIKKIKNIIVNAREDIYADVRDEHFVTKRMPAGTYNAVMNILFEPSGGVNMLLLSTIKKFGLNPKRYLAAHFRAG